MTSAQDVVERRRAARRLLLDAARSYLGDLVKSERVCAAVVVGSVARGDFHDASDIDLVIVADDLPIDAAERWWRFVPRHGLVQPVVWTPDEWRLAQRRRNPLVVDALDHGEWLVGSPETLRTQVGAG